ncbi:hypothetical protein BJ322DRAFT_1105944 [Thelephora terrestris]|uniref:Transmembrane protein n=1 Tax=Thelephora terrestris TaxID=56493 RepID=A0A9P6HK75_9AGAM|nr:hypothetical protein BJ322DRAFT_1105944 [Thelephora terrestris]
MVNWNSPTELLNNYDAFTKFMHALYGLYLWEFVLSIDFDWQFISGKKKFRWPLIFYFTGRYVLLLALTGIIASLNLRSQVDCQALYTFNQVMGNMAIGIASINLSLRTMAVWSQKWFIVVPLVALILGHWSLLMHGVLLKAAWIQGSCAIIYTNNKILAASFIYGMAFDFIVLCLTAWKLAFPSGGRSRLVTLIFGDGLIYFLVAFLSNLLATIFMIVDLNAVMSIIANVPAAIVSTIAASRIVRRLHNYSSEGAEVFVSTQGSTLAFRSGNAQRSLAVHKKTESVHVQMDTFPADNRPQQSFMDYDDAAKPQGENFDMESQAVTEEFKSRRPSY